MSRAGLAAELLEDEERLIPLRSACQFVEKIGRIEGVAHLGLHVGSRTPMRSLGLLGTLLGQATTLRDLIGKLVHWVPKVDSEARLRTEPVGEGALIKLCVRHDADVGHAIADGFALMLFIDAVRMATGPEWRAKRIWLEVEGTAEGAGFEELSEGEVIRSRNYTAFEIPFRDLERLLRAGSRLGGDGKGIH